MHSILENGFHFWKLWRRWRLLSNTSTGHKTITVRRQAPAPSGHGLQASLKRLSSELTVPEPLHEAQHARAPEAPILPDPQHVIEPQPATEPTHQAAAHHVSDTQYVHTAHDTSELHYYTGPFYYYMRCRSDGPVWTPEPSHSKKRGIALYTSVYIGAADVPSFLYVRCQSESPIWVPVSQYS